MIFIALANPRSRAAGNALAGFNEFYEEIIALSKSISGLIKYLKNEIRSGR
jgi:hypothetical protein